MGRVRGVVGEEVTLCLPCASADGCSTHQMFTCAKCRLLVPWSKGAADDESDWCDDCWNAIYGQRSDKRHAEALGHDPSKGPTGETSSAHLRK